MPEVVQWRLHSNDMLSAVNAGVAVASEGVIEGMTIWCNNALGLVWIATPPGRGVSSIPF
jgi:hypothetical protein